MPDEMKMIPIEQIVWKDPIRDFGEKDIEDMALSIRIHGYIEPIIVDFPDENGFYEGVCGRLRYEAAKRAGLKETLCRIHKFESAAEKKAWQLVENLHRRQLTKMQIIEGYAKLYQLYCEEYKGSTDAIIQTMLEAFEKLLPAEEVPSKDTIWKYLRISRSLQKEAKESVLGDTRFGLKHAEQLLRLKDLPDKQVELAKEFAVKPMTVQKLKREVDKILGVEKPKPGWTCSLCGQQQPPDETKTTITLCPICYAEFEEWRHERQKVESGEASLKT